MGSGLIKIVDSVNIKSNVASSKQPPSSKNCQKPKKKKPHVKIPTSWNPNSTLTKPNGDIRVFGPDGRAIKDIDKSHPEHHPELQNPHYHDWEWNDNKAERGQPRNPSDAEMFENGKEIVGTGIVVFGGGYLIYRGLRMLPSLIPSMWWTIPANLATP